MFRPLFDILSQVSAGVKQMALSTYSTATPSTTFRISVGDSASHVSAICVFFRGTYVMSSHNFNRPQVGKTSWSRIHQESKNMQCTLQIYTVHKNILEYDFFLFCWHTAMSCQSSTVHMPQWKKPATVWRPQPTASTLPTSPTSLCFFCIQPIRVLNT